MESTLIEDIKTAALRRRQIVKADTKLTLQIKGLCRGYCDGDKDEAEKLYKRLKNGDKTVPDDLRIVASPLFEAKEPLKKPRKDLEKVLEKLAMGLPVVWWIEKTRGVGYLGIAIIIGETGDLSLYSGPAKVWKRLGIGCIDGKKQFCPKGATKEEAMAIGYNRWRRSQSWVIADSMLRGQSERSDKETGEVTREAEPYRVLYDERKVLEIAKAPDARPVVHHMRAKRYVEKRFIRDLWCAWNNRLPAAMALAA